MLERIFRRLDFGCVGYYINVKAAARQRQGQHRVASKLDYLARHGFLLTKSIAEELETETWLVSKKHR